MDKSLHLMEDGKYESFTHNECFKNDEEHILKYMGLPIRLRCNVGTEYEEVEYGYICDVWWCNESHTIDCNALLFGKDGKYHGRFRYFLTSFEKLVGEIKKKDVFVYRVWDEENERWSKNFRNGKTLWSRKSDAENIIEEDFEVLKKFKLVEVNEK